MSDQYGGQQPPQQPGQPGQPGQPPQQPPPQQPQQGWQQPQQQPGQPGQQPQQWQQQPQGGGDGLDPKVGGLLAYLLGWIGGLIMLLTQKHPEVRFHGAQSILLTIVFVALYIVLWILGFAFAAAGIGFLASIVLLLANVVLWLAGLALWIFLIIKGYNLEHFKLPMIGDMAERWAAK